MPTTVPRPSRTGDIVLPMSSTSPDLATRVTDTFTTSPPWTTSASQRTIAGRSASGTSRMIDSPTISSAV